MRRSKGYADELEKLSRDVSGRTVVINLKNAATKILLVIPRLNIIMHFQELHNGLQTLYYFKGRRIIIIFLKVF